ncbi:TetR family transcriptional regulator (plasmid) [Acidiphilium multivorum]|nr:TetR family transcriptional regulator [Acidiphilium multivorum]
MPPRKTPSLSARRLTKAAAMARILSGAERVFAEAGLAGATMAQIAAAADLPKANVHYHLATKEGVYQAVLENILAFWLDASDHIQPGAEPSEALTRYIRAKMSISRARPYASRVFANEILHGAPFVRSYLGDKLRNKVEEKAAILEGWMAQGLMAPANPRHLFFLIWAMTQTYADFDAQIAAVLGVDMVGDREFAAGEALIVQLVLRGCGIVPRAQP